jgi:tetratricopeptide (TPR) repeat protein
MRRQCNAANRRATIPSLSPLAGAVALRSETACQPAFPPLSDQRPRPVRTSRCCKTRDSFELARGPRARCCLLRHRSTSAALGGRSNRAGALARRAREHERALAVRPDEAVVFNNRGAILQELKRFEDALASYEKAMALKPTSSARWRMGSRSFPLLLLSYSAGFDADRQARRERGKRSPERTPMQAPRCFKSAAMDARDPRTGGSKSGPIAALGMPLRWCFEREKRLKKWRCDWKLALIEDRSRLPQPVLGNPQLTATLVALGRDDRVHRLRFIWSNIASSHRLKLCGKPISLLVDHRKKLIGRSSQCAQQIDRIFEKGSGRNCNSQFHLADIERSTICWIGFNGECRKKIDL